MCAPEQFPARLSYYVLHVHLSYDMGCQVQVQNAHIPLSNIVDKVLNQYINKLAGPKFLSLDRDASWVQIAVILGK